MRHAVPVHGKKDQGDQRMIYEIIGIAGTVLILIAFLNKSEKRIRVFDAVGAVCFVVYGLLTKTWSTAILNFALIIIQAVKLARLYGKERRG